MNNSLRELRYPDALPLALRQMRDGLAAVEQITARAADEIERLITDLAEARAALRDLMVLADNKFIDEDDGSYWNFWRNDHAAALKAAREAK